jgi:phosphatidylinositol alpha-mannosyltransferase
MLASHGDAVTIVGPGAKAGSDDRFRAVSVGRIRPIRANGSIVPLATGHDIAGRIREVAADLDVLHVHEPLMPMVGPAALRTGCPVVATFHARPRPWVGFAYRALSPVFRRWFRTAVMTAVSRAAAQAPRPLGPVAVIPNGLDVGSYLSGLAKIPGQVIFLGRKEPRKGLQVLTAAWPLVRAAHPAATLVVIGQVGPDSVDGIEYRGRVSESEKRRLLGEASIMVAPNLGGESFGLVVAEGMASGCAVVASDLPGFREVVADAAELVAPGQPGELADAINRLLAEPPKITALGVAGRTRVGDFDWKQVLPKYRACYERAAATHRGGG